MHPLKVTLQLPSNESRANSVLTSTSHNNNSTTTPNQSFRTHNPYPLELVYVKCFEDNVIVMNSLQKPKKVTIRGTDGKLYAFLCKAKDDLRIDYRIMEFFSVVNKCLKQEPESRRRNLYIRTYAVTPLNENSGIIEWIENLATLRSILLKLYSERKVGSMFNKYLVTTDYSIIQQFLRSLREAGTYRHITAPTDTDSNITTLSKRDQNQLIGTKKYRNRDESCQKKRHFRDFSQTFTAFKMRRAINSSFCNSNAFFF